MHAMKRMKCAPAVSSTLSLTLACLAVGGGAAAVVHADPVAFGRPVELYAHVLDPMMMSFAPNGDLFVGRENYGSGGGSNDAVAIHRVAAQTRAVTEFGAPIADPDAVLYDATGAFTGHAGSVLVGGSTPLHNGILSEARTNGTSATLTGPSLTFINPNDFAVAANGRAIFADFTRNDVKVITPTGVQSLFTVSDHPFNVAVDPHNGDIYTTAINGVMSRHNAAGNVITPTFATGLGEYDTVAVEPDNSLLRGVPADGGAGSGSGGGTGGGDGGGGVIVARDYSPVVYSIANGQLLRLDAAGHREVLGEGFGHIFDIGFGPDGALYASDFDSDRILRIVPEPSSLALLGLAMAMSLKRRR